jgi:hypothetical protein
MPRTQISGRRQAVADLPLHGGKAPPWLFKRMKHLSAEIIQAVAYSYEPAEMLRRLADPFWFQALGCVLGFDWHSSGLTTVTCGALKEACALLGGDAGIHVAGGKGAASRKTPQEIEKDGESLGIDPEPLVYASRMSAKVDSAALQDGFQVYHHTFFFTGDGLWAVVQQGMNETSRYARRYHWLSHDAAQPENFVCEPHAGIVTTARLGCLNMVARESEENRLRSVEIAKLHPDKIMKEFKSAGEDLAKIEKQLSFGFAVEDDIDASLPREKLIFPAHHEIRREDFNVKRLNKLMRTIYENPPADYQQLLGIAGVGPKTVRALSLLSELIFEAPISRRDPAFYSHAHGGKDGHPFPVQRQTYDRSIEVLREAVNQAKIGRTEKMEALKRLSQHMREVKI